MDLKLSELIKTLTELQAVAGENAPTNVSAVRLKASVSFDYGTDSYGYTRREGKRTRDWSIWCESFTDGPQMAAEQCAQGLQYDPELAKRALNGEVPRG